jgi:hypothetical protein
MKNPPMKRNKLETPVQVADRLGERWVRKSGEKIKREGEHTCKCVHGWLFVSE